MPDAVFHARAARSAQLKSRVTWLAIGILSGSVAVGGAWRLLSPSHAPQITKASSDSVAVPALAAPVQQAPAVAKQADASPTDMTLVSRERVNPPAVVPAAPEHKPVQIVQQPGPVRGVGEKINLNTATAEQIALLPGIGPKLAASIVADREKNGKFKRVADLDRVKGIGRKKLDAIRSSVVVD
jgi:competence protein ComEA